MIAHLRKLVPQFGSGLFDVDALLSVSPSIAKLCGWARRIIAGIFAAALSKVRSDPALPLLAGQKQQFSQVSVDLKDMFEESPMADVISRSAMQLPRDNYLVDNHLHVRNRNDTAIRSNLWIFAAIFPQVHTKVQHHEVIQPQLKVDFGNAPVSIHLPFALAIAKATDRLNLLLFLPSSYSPLIVHGSLPTDVHNAYAKYANLIEHYEVQLRFASASPVHQVIPIILSTKAGSGGYAMSERFPFLMSEVETGSLVSLAIPHASASSAFTTRSFLELSASNHINSTLPPIAVTTPQQYFSNAVTSLARFLQEFGLQLNPAVYHVAQVCVQPDLLANSLDASLALLVVPFSADSDLPTLIQPLVPDGGDGMSPFHGVSPVFNAESDTSTIFGGNISRETVIRG
jgi:hypothetical protein